MHGYVPRPDITEWWKKKKGSPEKQGKEANSTAPSMPVATSADAQLEGMGEEEEMETGDAPPLDSLGRLPTGTCYKCGPILACKTQRCTYCKEGRQCTDCLCRGCANVPSPRLEAKERTSDGGEGGSQKAARRKGPDYKCSSR